MPRKEETEERRKQESRKNNKSSVVSHAWLKEKWPDGQLYLRLRQVTRRSKLVWEDYGFAYRIKTKLSLGGRSEAAQIRWIDPVPPIRGRRSRPSAQLQVITYPGDPESSFGWQRVDP